MTNILPFGGLVGQQLSASLRSASPKGSRSLLVEDDACLMVPTKGPFGGVFPGWHYFLKYSLQKSWAECSM